MVYVRSSMALAIPLYFGLCPWHWWRLLGPGTTLFSSISFVVAYSLSSFNLLPSALLLLDYFFRPLSRFAAFFFSLFLTLSFAFSLPLFLPALFIYSFGPAATLCPLVRRPVRCSLVVGRCPLEYFCSRNSSVRRRPTYTDLPSAERERVRGGRGEYLPGR